MLTTIDHHLVIKVIEPIWSTKTETAPKVLGRIESILGWAIAKDFRQGENPARWSGLLENLLPSPAKVRPKVKHRAALDYRDIARFIVKLRHQENVAARALEFTILTAVRTGEAIGGRWDEINFDDRLWTVPAERMKVKSNEDHVLPLSDAAVAILETMARIRQGDFVFPGLKRAWPISNMAMLVLLQRRMGRRDLTVHGFRSTFRTWVDEECTGVDDKVAEVALAHNVGDAMQRAYRRGVLLQKRRLLMQAWAEYCNNLSAVKGEMVHARTPTSTRDVHERAIEQPEDIEAYEPDIETTEALYVVASKPKTDDVLLKIAYMEGKLAQQDGKPRKCRYVVDAYKDAFYRGYARRRTAPPRLGFRTRRADNRQLPLRADQNTPRSWDI